ncbi:unnamed protein product [Durusdinium trenchii]|uniref:Uncharacterized protein n=1 Tax=Durusdinium trenchii TaxID=1381693 RepID=A0ABP0PK88_9DINO
MQKIRKHDTTNCVFNELMVAENRLQLVLETIQSDPSRHKLEPLGQCPGCRALFPSCLGVLAAWEHIKTQKESHTLLCEKALAALEEDEVESAEEIAVLNTLGFKVIEEADTSNESDAAKDVSSASSSAPKKSSKSQKSDAQRPAASDCLFAIRSHRAEGGPDEVDKERHPRRGEGGEGIPASEGNRDHADVAAVIDSDVVLTVLIADTTDDPIDDREVGGAKAEADGAVRLIVVGSQSWCLSLLTNWQLCSCWTFWLVLACYLVKDLRKRSAQAGKGDFVPWPRKPMPSERRSSRLLCFFLFVCFTADGPS